MAEDAPPARLVEVSFAAIEGWREDDHVAALACLRISARRTALKPYTTKALGIDAAGLARIGALALSQSFSPDGARQFFEEQFRPLRIEPPSGGTGFVTGYFEPELEASPVRTPRFSYPLYARPPDLADIDDATRPPGMDASFMFARRTQAGFSEYPDRAAIEAGFLAGKRLEIAWIESPVDGFFIHIQGSARLLMPDGDVWRVSYAGKSGHPFTPIGAWLVANGHLRREDVTMDTIRNFLLADEGRARELMNRNRSFIFFQRTSQENPDLGPVAAAGVALTPGRSLAVDHRLHTFGTPVFVATHEPLPQQSAPFRRLMLAQDTGSAIIGPARGDLFIGSGREAGSLAGGIKHSADFTVLAPRSQETPR
jgi:membrane-bound lytic murein transglycosylase A